MGMHPHDPASELNGNWSDLRFEFISNVVMSVFELVFLRLFGLAGPLLICVCV